MRLEDALTRAITGGRRQKPTVRGTVRDAERALGSKRAIAERLGVSVRTVQRWAKGASKPRGENATRLSDLGRSSDVRGALGPRKRARLRGRGGRVRSNAYQGPLIGPAAGPGDYRRERLVSTTLSADAMDRILTAWEGGDDEAARAELERAMEEEYGVTGWSFGEVDDFSLLFD